MGIVRCESWLWRAWQWGGVGAIVPLFVEITFLPNCVNAQPVADTTLGAEQSIVSPFSHAIDRIDGGATRGINLFHSFREFTIGTNRGAYFFVPSAAIQNVLARVTGTNRSEILGVLGVRNLINNTLLPSNANLFLINPNGIIFGSGASLDVGGSFVATTANAIQFADRGSFSASVPELPSSLLTINPSAFLFNQLVQQPRNAIENRAFLRVPNGRSLLLLGGNISPTTAATGNILLEGNGNLGETGLLVAGGGRVQVGSVGSIGVVELANKANQLSFKIANLTERTDIFLINSAGILVAASNGGGEASLDGRNVTLSGGSRLVAGILAGGNPPNVQAGDITITAMGDLRLEEKSAIGNRVLSTILGQGGNVTIVATNLSVQSGSQIDTSIYGQGKSGNLTITVRQTASFDGKSQDSLLSSGAFSNVSPGAIGTGGDLTLAAGNLFVTNGAQLSSSTFGQGRAGNLTITVRDTAVFDGTAQNGAASGAFSSVDPGAIGDGGNLSLTAGNLFVTNGARLTSSTVGQGRAGNLIINVRDTAVFDGKNRSGTIASVAASSVEPGAIGDGGNLSLTAGNLFVTNGAYLSASTLGQGNVGSLTINVRDTIKANNGSFQTSSVQGSGGAITIAARTIRLFGDSDITTSIFSGVGGGGDITLTADSIVALEDSDILAFAQDGRGGNITLNTRAFFGQNYRPAPFGTDPRTLDNNNRVDINASGAVSGIITLPDVSFIQNSLTQLPQVPIDTNTLLANSCIVRRNQPTGNFFITGSGGLPERPGTASSPAFPTGEVQNVEEPEVRSQEPGTKTQNSSAGRPWKIGDPIMEPQGVYQLPDGQLVLSHACL